MIPPKLQSWQNFVNSTNQGRGELNELFPVRSGSISAPTHPIGDTDSHVGGKNKNTSRAPVPTKTSTAPSSNFLLKNWKVEVKIALLIGFWVFIIWFFPDTVPGKALLEATGFTKENKWYPWVMQYLPTGILAWVGYHILTTSSTPSTAGAKGSGLGATIVSILGWVALGAFIWALLYYQQKWKEESPTGPLVASYVFRTLADGPKKELIDRTGRMEVHFQPPAGAIWYVCGRVIGPAIVRSHSSKPGVDMKLVQAPPGWHYYEFSDEFVDFLKENDVRAPLLVEFTLREAPGGAVPATCPK